MENLENNSTTTETSDPTPALEPAETAPQDENSAATVEAQKKSLAAKIKENPKGFILKFVLPVSIALALLITVVIFITNSDEYRLNQAAKTLEDIGEAEIEQYYLILSVWSNSENKIDDPSTNAYTKPDGYFISDISLAIENLLGSDEFMTTNQEIERKLNSVGAEIDALLEEADRVYDFTATLMSVHCDLYEISLEFIKDPLGIGLTYNDLEGYIDDIRNCLNTDFSGFISEASRSK